MRSISPTLSKYLNDNPGVAGNIVLPTITPRRKTLSEEIREHGVHVFLISKDMRHDN